MKTNYPEKYSIFLAPSCSCFQVLAGIVTDGDLAEGRVYPPLSDIREVSTQLATKIVEYAYDNDMAATYPEPEDKEAFVRQHQYSTEYESFVPEIYSWPGVIE